METDTTFIYSEAAKRKAKKRKALEEGLAEQQKLAALVVKATGPAEPWEHRPPHPPCKETAPAAAQPAVRQVPVRTTSARAATVKTTPVKTMAVKVIRKPQGAVSAVSAAAPRTAPMSQRAVATAPRAAATAQQSGAASAMRPAPSAAGRPQEHGAARAAAKAAAPRVALRTRPRPAPGASRAAPRSTVAGPLRAPELKASEERLLLESEALDLFGTGSSTNVCVCPDCHHELVRVVCLGTAVRACLECKGVWLALPVVKEFARNDEWFQQVGSAIQAAARPPAGP